MNPNLKMFSTEYQPNNRNGGRRPSKLKTLVKSLELSKTDVKKIFIQLLADADETELKTMIENPKMPFLMRGYIKAMLTDFKKGDISTLKEMIEWTFGKAEQKSTNEISGGLSIHEMTPEERKARIEALNAKRT